MPTLVLPCRRPARLVSPASFHIHETLERHIEQWLTENLQLQLFDDKASKDKVSSGTSKDAVVQKATEVAMKMYLKSQGEQQGGLVGLASKFMK